MPYFIQSILEGSENPSALSLIQEVHKINLSLIIAYADAIIKRGIRSVAILGLSVKGNQKSIDFSPSVILAEYLSSSGIIVYIDEPLYNKIEILEILPTCKPFDIFTDKVFIEALFVMNDHNKFKFITQNDIKQFKLDNIPVIIDNVPLFNNYTFGLSTIYHAIGDGKIKIL
jgi:UDP-N-acetyl-D-mannosaminuronate dehydrogenase